MLLARLILVCCSMVALQGASNEKPNIIFILTDDQGWFDLGVNGNPHIETPVLDKLAGEGVRFTHFYAPPVCTPTRAGLLTGRFFQRTGAIDTYMGRDVLGDGEVTVPSLIQQRGYRTGCIGKWHLGRYARFHPNERGFHDYFGFWQHGFMNRYMDPEELYLNKQPVKASGYITDLLTDAAIEFVDKNRAEPFFLYLAYNAPHDPHLVPDAYIARYLKKGLPIQQARIYGMITTIDENVGRLLAKVDSVGLRDNTVVIFMTDNGGVSTYYKGGLRGNKGSVYEGGVRVPLLVRWPGQFPEKRVVTALAQYVDLFPTLCELTGATVPEDRVIDGKTLLPLLRGQSEANNHEFICQQWTRVQPNPNTNWMIRDAQFKLVNGQLFDLEADPGEAKDLAETHPEKARVLRKRFETWFNDVTTGVDYSRRHPIEVGRPDENPVELDVMWAELDGNVKPHFARYHRDALKDWKASGDAARWQVKVVQPGTYRLKVAYGAVPRDTRNEFEFRAGEAAALQFDLPGTLLPDIYEERMVGSVQLTRGQTTVQLGAKGDVSGADLRIFKLSLERE